MTFRFLKEFVFTNIKYFKERTDIFSRKEPKGHNLINN